MGSIFFFVKAEKAIIKNFNSLFKGEGNSRLGKYGYYPMKTEIAKDGVFNKANLSPVEGVEQSNLYDVMMYAMIEKLKIPDPPGKKTTKI